MKTRHSKTALLAENKRLRTEVKKLTKLNGLLNELYELRDEDVRRFQAEIDSMVSRLRAAIRGDPRGLIWPIH